MKRGKLIAFEGIDRAGKTTVSQQLAKTLPNTVYFRFPDRTTPTGILIDQYLTQKLTCSIEQISLYFAQNRHELKQAILDQLAQGKTVILDQYIISGAVYGLSRGLPFEQILQHDLGLPLPDLTLFLYLDPEVAATRTGYGTERHEQLDFQQQVAANYQMMLRQPAFVKQVIQVDASKSIGEVSDLCEEAIVLLAPSKPLRFLE